MLASNNFCKLPAQVVTPSRGRSAHPLGGVSPIPPRPTHPDASQWFTPSLRAQDGERLEGERGLTSAEDITYWTDSTYTNDEVLHMEAKLLYHLCSTGGAPLTADAPLHFLCTCAAAVPTALHEHALSIALELLCLCTKEYRLLVVEPSLLAAACLCLGVTNAPHGHAAAWDRRLVAATGYELPRLVSCHHAHLGFVRDKPLACRSLGSGIRAKSLHCTIIFP